MHITLESDYAVRIIYCLAMAGCRMDAKRIAEDTGVTLRFSLKILRKLVAGGFIVSYKGTKGGYELEDCGCFDETSVDYPDYGAAVARKVVQGQADKGIIVCGTGIGISIAANKIKGIRAALCGDVYSAKLSRMHNDANILALGQRVVGPGLALEILDAWLTAEFEGGRHQKRLHRRGDHQPAPHRLSGQGRGRFLPAAGQADGPGEIGTEVVNMFSAGMIVIVLLLILIIGAVIYGVRR